MENVKGKSENTAIVTSTVYRPVNTTGFVDTIMTQQHGVLLIHVSIK